MRPVGSLLVSLTFYAASWFAVVGAFPTAPTWRDRVSHSPSTALEVALVPELLSAPAPVYGTGELIADVVESEEPIPGVKEKSLSPTIEQLMDLLTELRTKRAALEKEEKEIIAALRKRLEEQQQRLQQIGVLLNGAASPPPVAPPVKPVPVPPPAPLGPAEEFAAAWRADRDSRQGSYEDVQALARAYANAGESLERARPPTVGHLLEGLEIRNRVQLGNKLPRVHVLARQFLATRMPPSGAVLTPILPGGVKVAPPPEMQACKQVLLELSGILEKVQP